MNEGIASDVAGALHERAFPDEMFVDLQADAGGRQSIGNFNLTLSPTEHAASTFVELSMLTGDGHVRT